MLKYTRNLESVKTERTALKIHRLVLVYVQLKCTHNPARQNINDANEKYTNFALAYVQVVKIERQRHTSKVPQFAFAF